MSVSNGSIIKTVHLEDSLLVPNLRTNLISVSKITDREHEVIFRKNDSYGLTRMVADRIGSLYYMRGADKKVQPLQKSIT